MAKYTIHQNWIICKQYLSSSVMIVMHTNRNPLWISRIATKKLSVTKNFILKKEKHFIFRMCSFRGTCFVYELLKHQVWPKRGENSRQRDVDESTTELGDFSNILKYWQTNRIGKLGFRVYLHFVKVSCRSLGRDLLVKGSYLVCEVDLVKDPCTLSLFITSRNANKIT